MLSRQAVQYAFILALPQNIFAQEVLRGINQAREELVDAGAEVSLHFTDAIDGARQAELIDRLVGGGVKGIVLVPVDCATVRRAVERGARAGAAFVTLATDLERSRRLCFVGQDNLASGRVAGELMGFLAQRGDEIACVVGSKQFRGHAQRVEGFRQTYEREHAPEDIIAVVENLDSAELSERLVEELLRAHPRLRGLFVAGGGMGGICAALRRAGRKVRVVGYDLVQCERPCVEGLIDFVIDQNPGEEGRRALSLLNAFVIYGERPTGRQLTRIDVHTRETLRAMRERRGGTEVQGRPAIRGGERSSGPPSPRGSPTLPAAARELHRSGGA